MRIAVAAAACCLIASAAQAQDFASEVNPFIGSTNGGNTFPGATLPFGMVAFSPEETPLPGRNYPIAAPGGYEWRANGIKGFSLTHLSGTGCTGASGDVPIMPVTKDVEVSPAMDDGFTIYSSWFSHADEQASPGAYKVALANGVSVDLSATLRTGIARFVFPKDKPANLLFRTSDSEIGSSDATVHVDPQKREVTGSVTSGNFCGYLSPDRRESYYTLHFVAKLDQPFTAGGAWQDATLTKGASDARGGTTYGDRGHPPGRKGSGAWIAFQSGATVNLRVGVSYVSLGNARANLATESAGETLESVRDAAREAWNAQLGRIAVRGGSKDQRTVFYTALYHVLLGENTYSDANGEYLGFDNRVHKVERGQRVQYANFSGWDVYRSQLALVTWLDPKRGSDIAQSLLNQANQNDGVWDRWTHLTGATSVMNGDPSPPSIAAIWAFGGHSFDMKSAYASLLKAATVPTALDLTHRGCPVQCVGERPGLDVWLKLHYMPVGSPGWGSAADTLELAAADFGVAQLAEQNGDAANAKLFRARAGWWRNLFNPNAAPEGGYIQPRNADGTWKSVDFDVENDDDYVEGSGAQYLWMVPFDPAGLFEALGGVEKASARMDRFFYNPDGSLAVTKSGYSHAELDNEPSIASPWLYDFAGAPWKTQEIVRAAMNRIWTNAPNGISGNDDLGEMSSWYVWAALGMYPLYPGRADLALGSPLFDDAFVSRPGGTLAIHNSGATGAPYVAMLVVDGKRRDAPWLPASFVLKGGSLDYTLSRAPNKAWGRDNPPPSFGP